MERGEASEVVECWEATLERRVPRAQHVILAASIVKV